MAEVIKDKDGKEIAKIATPEEAMWQNVSESLEREVKRQREALKVNEEFLKTAKYRLQVEQQKSKRKSKKS